MTAGLMGHLARMQGLSIAIMKKKNTLQVWEFFYRGLPILPLSLNVKKMIG